MVAMKGQCRALFFPIMVGLCLSGDLFAVIWLRKCKFNCFALQAHFLGLSVCQLAVILSLGCEAVMGEVSALLCAVCYLWLLRCESLARSLVLAFGLVA